jgi:hypothetical protein
MLQEIYTKITIKTEIFAERIKQKIYRYKNYHTKRFIVHFLFLTDAEKHESNNIIKPFCPI